jgi:hypothetical protein
MIPNYDEKVAFNGHLLVFDEVCFGKRFNGTDVPARLVVGQHYAPKAARAQNWPLYKVRNAAAVVSAFEIEGRLPHLHLDLYLHRCCCCCLHAGLPSTGVLDLNSLPYLCPAKLMLMETSALPMPYCRQNKVL